MGAWLRRSLPRNENPNTQNHELRKTVGKDLPDVDFCALAWGQGIPANSDREVWLTSYALTQLRSSSVT